MNKNVYELTLSYQYVAEHSGSHYTINNGISFMNGGEFSEVGLKHCKGYEAIKDARGRYDLVSDINETRTSIKSSKATLVNMVLGDSFEAIKKEYFKNVHSTNWSWVVIIEDTLIEYNMNRNEFEEFMDEWSSYYEPRKVIRFKNCGPSMVRWLEMRVG